jgi:hypothetical protein
MAKKTLFSIFIIFFAKIFLFLPATAEASPIGSSTWGFYLDLPEEYELAAGDMKNTFSFQSALGAVVDIKVYAPGTYRSVEALSYSIQKQIGNKGESEIFTYQKKKAAFFELDFSMKNSDFHGYGVCLELDKQKNGVPMLLVLSYNAENSGDLSVLHLSALDSIAPNQAALHIPGPVAEYSYPREERKIFQLAGGAGEAFFFENDAEAAQYVVDREYQTLVQYLHSPSWKEAWKRFFRMVYRDSFDRLQHAAFVLERKWRNRETRAFADKALKWVQNFEYERDLEGSDFVNLVSASIEGRGDCDSRALLWAILMEQADIPAGLMVSREYAHAMGLVAVEGAGARFMVENKQWLVAETTAHVDIGLIAESVKDPQYWFGVIFEIF